MNKSDKEYKSAYAKEWRKKNKEYVKLKKREEYLKNRDKYLERELIKNYGINMKQYNEMLKEQDNCCAICRVSKDKSIRAFDVDHDHKTGYVRGLLCNLCNIGLGSFRDSSEYIRNAFSYLTKYEDIK